MARFRRACFRALILTVSLLVWGAGIPNPLLSDRYDIAFNLADLAVGSGFLLLLPATLAFAMRHRDRLNSPL